MFAEGQLIATDPLVVNNKILQKQGPMRAQIRMGEIMKLRREEKVPSLEVIVEMENDQVNPVSQFIYLHPVDDTINLQSLNQEKIYKIESLEWADNIGKSYIRLDFDRTKK